MSDDYFYDYGWHYEDNKGKAYRSVNADLLYRVVKYYKNGSMENVTDPMSRDEAIEKLKQIQLLDPVGQMDWVERWHEAEQERQEQRNAYLTAKGRL